jgi:general secretion pathway protein M
MKQIRQWLDGLAPRERNLVYAAAALLGIAVVYFAVVLPVTSAARHREARIVQKTSDLAWMQQVAPQVMAAAAAGGGVASDESLVVLVDRTARESGIGSSIRDQTPAGQNGLQLRLEGAPFDLLMAWLANLQQQHGVRVDGAIIGAANAPGLVNANLTLAHGQSPAS